MFGTLQLTRTNPAHIGTASLQQVQNIATKANTKADATTANIRQDSFENYLMQAVSSLNEKQMQVGDLQKQLLVDPDSVDIQDVTIAMGKAQMTLNLAQSVADRIIKGWSEVTTTR